MRLPLLAGNWKMNLTLSETEALIKGLKDGLKPSYDDREILVCPPYTNITKAVELSQGTAIQVGAQNLYTEKSGAYTGEISASMIKSTGATFVIIGHSERREYFNEDDQTLAKKIELAIEEDLIPVFCCGEKLEEREQGNEKKVVSDQVVNALKGFDKNTLSKLVIAYEPVWAIGTGKTASPEQAQEMHKFIRDTLAKTFDQNFADTIRILYGGSVKPDNVDDLMSRADIDGALVGGASLKADSFLRIINFS